jgi:hypothetical protein
VLYLCGELLTSLQASSEKAMSMNERPDGRHCFKSGQLLLLATLLAWSLLAPGNLGAQYADGISIFVQPNASPPGRLVIDPNPEKAFLAMYLTGASSNERWDFVFFGDGRLQVARYYDHRSTSPDLSWTSQASADEMSTLLREIANGKLYEFNTSAALDRETRLGIVRPAYEDLGSRYFHVSLLKLAPDSDHELGIVENGFWLPNGIFMPHAEAGLEEFQAMRRLVAMGRDIQTRAFEVVK